MSEAEPEKQDPDAAYVLVGTSFKDMDKNKAYFVEFCKFCRHKYFNRV